MDEDGRTQLGLGVGGAQGGGRKGSEGGRVVIPSSERAGGIIAGSGRSGHRMEPGRILKPC